MESFEEGNKRRVIDVIFRELVQKYPKSEILNFHNEKVKEVSSREGIKFRNQFDATKFDSYALLPKSLQSAGFFIVHLGKGNHAFVKGNGYHKFEKIRTIKEWRIEKSIIDSLSDSEAQSASTAFNDRIIHDFLFEDKNEPLKLHTARRAKISYDFVIDGKTLRTDKLQIEMDGIYESEKRQCIAVVEVKNQDHEDFEIRQLFSPMKYFEKMRGWKMPNEYKIKFVFLVRIRKNNRDRFKLYEYDFVDKMNPNSIRFIKAWQYDIIT
ncbi:hypothetical protein HYV89_02750 [Candidatus Woesearchaeota archaeon]|nr:hypothetical protein [Candidatus Woesearchaeota archaeon]